MKERKTFFDICFDVFIYVVFGAFTFACIFPFYYIFINSISGNDVVTQGLITFYPQKIQFTNYIDVLKMKALPRAFFITISRTILGTGLSVLCNAFVAYAVTKHELWHRKFVYRFFIITMYFNAGLIPWFINMRNLHLTNNFLAYIIGVISAFNIILVKTYIESIPVSLEESAEIDGAGYITIFFRIMLPLCIPILATISVFTAVGHWNSFMDTLLLMRDEKLFTLQFLLWRYLNESNAIADAMRNLAASGAMIDMAMVITPTSVKMTIAMIVTLPVLVVYPFFQRYFVKGIMLGAIKGG